MFLKKHHFLELSSKGYKASLLRKDSSPIQKLGCTSTDVDCSPVHLNA